MTTWPWTDARLHAAQTRIAELEASVAELEAERAHWLERWAEGGHHISVLEARLAAVLALCDEVRDGPTTQSWDCVGLAIRIRAAATGTDPEPGVDA